ncbi:YhdP family protein [Henriciella aquimarina]|uniref:YhdP family protein n=1 Tax=Henriciella aquimarina TaxID=545261 RepID=UPI000A071A99|nr:DUF3971 domain-containing protein [Henriciella aquimarina]
MVRQTATVVTLELLGGILLLAVAAVVILAFMLASGPVELSIFKSDVERALEEARDGRNVEIEQLTLQWSPSDRRVIVSAEQLRLDDADGQPAARADEALITLDAGSLVFGRTEVLRTEMRDGWVDVRNVTPTLWTFGGEPLPEFEVRALPETPAEWLDRANDVLGDILSGLKASRQDAGLEAVSFERMDLRFHGSDGTLIGEMTAASGSYTQTDTEGIRVRLAGGGEGLGLPGDLDARMIVPVAFDNLSLSLAIDDWSVGNLATRLGAPPERISGFPADIGFGLRYEPSAGLTQIALDAEAEEGQFQIGDRSIDVDELGFDFDYDPQADELQINRLDVVSKLISGSWEGSVNQPVAESGDTGFDLKSSALSIDFTPYFPQAWRFTDIDLQGTLNHNGLIVRLDRLAFTSDDMVMQGEGTFRPETDIEPGQLPFHLDIEASMEGGVEVSDVFKYWPETLGAGARRFAVKRIKAGRATAANVSLTLAPESFEQGYLRDDDLDVRFVVENGHVRFMDSLPPVTRGVGSGRLTGNGFSVNLSSGEIDGWQLTEGSVQFPKFNPKGELFRVEARGRGPLVNAMRNISESRFLDEEARDFDPERFSGTADLTFEMYRPALDDVPMSDIDITVTGTVTDARLENALPGLDLVGAEADVDLTDQRLVLTGFGDLGPAPVQFTWRDEFDDEGAPANLSASSFISPDFLNRFGFVGRAYLSGDIPVEVQALVATGGVERVQIGFDLQQSRIDLSELGWIKPAGEVASATLTYGEGSNMTASTLEFRSERARFDGDVRVSTEGRLQELQVREAYVEDFLEVSGDIIRQEDDTFTSNLEGAFLDASAFFGDIGGVDGAAGFSIPLTLDAAIDTLRLRDGLELSDATLNFRSTKVGVRDVAARGQMDGGQGELSAVYTGPTPEKPASVDLESDDAGFFMRGLLGQDFLSGGTLALEGTLARGDTPAHMRLMLRDVRMQNAPFLTQVLSLASLRGLADTLSGEGVLFSDIEVPVTAAGNRFIIDGARANGPALGLTMNGYIGQGGEDIRLSGVLVPSFGVNSMLGGVPVIGDLFVGREGEGIFSLTYSVRGNLNKAQVAINPLSAVTPGILRRIFENPADTSIPEGLPVDPNRTPPAPPMPDAEFIPSAPGSSDN